MNKRLLSLLLALLMLVSIVPTAAFAAVGDGELPIEAPAADEDAATLAEVEIPTGAVDAAEEEPPATLFAAVPTNSHNIAQGRPIYVSSDPHSSKGKAVDGAGPIGGGSQWSSAPVTDSAPQWLVVDLGEGTHQLSEVKIWYNGPCWPETYELQTAAVYDDANRDATTWETIATVSRPGSNANENKVANGNGQDIADTANNCDTLTASSTPALTATQLKRYIRFYVTKVNSLGPANDLGVVEFQVMDPTVTNAAAVLEELSLDLTLDSDDKVTGVALSGTVPQGYTATIAANLEQVVGPDGTIYTPLVDTQVELAIEVAKDDGSDRATTPYASVQTVTIKGAHTADENTGNPKPAVIPEIMEWYSPTDQRGRNFALATSYCSIYYNDAGLEGVVLELQKDLRDLCGVDFGVSESGSAQSGEIELVLATGDAVAGFDNETYKMEVTDKVVITAKSATGAYWGTRTLLQALKLSGDKTVPQGTARDYPEFKVRGYVMDVGRKPMSMGLLQNIVKNMSWYKLNDFHVHLNDNLIFMEDYGVTANNYTNPEDYAKANDAYSAFRMESEIKPEEGGSPLTAKDYAYSKAEFKQFISDSAAIGVNIVPEFDAPAHAKSIADAFPSLRLQNVWGGAWGYDHPANCHLDLTGKYEQSLTKVQEIFDEYLNESDPVFTGSVVHFGADEYFGTGDRNNADNGTPYRKFMRDMIAYLKEKGKTPRVWGSLSHGMISTTDSTLQFNDKAKNKGVQMNIWNTTWANPQAMYNLGFDLINVTDGPFYMVPSGDGGRYGYGDYLNLTDVYNKAPNQIGDTWFPASSSQILGEAYAIWDDSMTDTRSTGMDEVDVFDRFFDTLPVIAVRQWGEGEALDRTLAEVQADAAILGTAPRTNPYCEAGETDSFTYTFADNTDSSGNAHTLTVGGSAQVSRGVLNLNGGESYATTGLDKLGWGNQLSFKVFKLQGGGEEQVIFESDHLAADSAYPYNEYAIKALPVANKTDKWKLGFSRELHDYEFDVELPVGQWVTLTLTNAQQSTKLSVNGGAPVAAVGKLIAKPNSNTQFRGKTGITNSSFAFPVARIGSKTNALVGYVDNVTTGEVADIPDTFLTATAPSELKSPAGSKPDQEGPASFAVDGDTGTMWHSNWSTDSPDNPNDLSDKPDKRYIQLNLATPVTVSGLSYTPRSNYGNGTVTKYRIEVSTDGTTFTSVATGDWARNADKKTVTFDTPQQNIIAVRLYGVETYSNNQYMTATEVELAYDETISLTDANTQITLGEVVWGEDAATVSVSVALKPSGFPLTEGTDYDVEYSSNTNPGTATVTITGTGSYTGTVTATFTVPAKPVPVDLAACTVALVGDTSYPYTGSPITPKVTVTTAGSEALLEGLDYTLTYQRNVNAGNGTAQVTVNAVSGKTTGSSSATFSITPVDFSSTATLTGIAPSYGLRPGGVTPEPTAVTWKGRTLVKNTDYTLSYENNEAVTAQDGDPAAIIVTGKGNFTGTVRKTFVITEETPAITEDDVTLQGGDTFTYTGGPISPTVIVSINGYYLVPDRDYTVSYANNMDLGEATVTVTGKDNYTGTVTKTFTIARADLSEATVTLPKLSYDHTGKAITPVPEVKMGSRTLRDKLDYTVSYEKNVDPGIATVTVTGVGNYEGSASRFFVINETGQGGSSGGNTGGSSSGGSSTTSTSKQPDGASVTTKTDASGAKTSTATYPNGAKVTADIPVNGPVTAVVTVPASADKVTVTVPTRETPTPGHIAVILHPDGTEEIVKTALPNETGLAVTLEEDAIVQVVDNTRTFADVPADSWAKDAITFVTSREIFNGTGSDTFSPADDMSRAMVCTVLANLAGQDTKGGATWYEKSLAWAKENGISDGTVPHATITREQLAAMLYRYAGSPDTEGALPDGFRDKDAVAEWAAQAVAWAVENDLLRGRGSESGLDLAPTATATRAEVAAVLQRFVALSR